MRKVSLWRTLLPVVLTVLSVAILLPSCIKEENYSDIPEIGFQELKLYFLNENSVFADSLQLTISFKDGDGNIGLRERDTLPPFDPDGEYYYNFIVRYFEKRDSGYVEVILSDPSFNSRIPVLNPQYPGKPIKGFITITLPSDPSPDYDTVRMDVFIYDRALNKSNIVTTPDIVLRRSGI